MKRISYVPLLVSILITALSTVPASSNAQAASPWCGNGSQVDKYGFTYDLEQKHWTVGNGLVSEEAMTEVDVILDQLNADQLAQTMILVLPADQVGLPVNCAVHFLRYMKLGLVAGPHKDNGFTFLFVVGQSKIDVHYGVGLGLPALTAQGLTPLNRLAEETFNSTKSLDIAVTETIKAYDTYVRSKYIADPAPVSENEDSESALADAIAQLPWQLKCALIIILIFLLYIAIVYGGSSGGGGTYRPTGTTRTGGFGGGGGGGKTGGGGRGGSGSGRSARGN